MIPAPVELALPKILECLSCLLERKTGIAGVVMQRGVGRGLGCASRVTRAGGGWTEAGMSPGGWEHLCPPTTGGSGLSNAAPGPAGLIQTWDQK